GFENNDTIQGGAGNDTLDGKGGSDTYLYARGDGHDSINEDPSYNSAIVDKLVLSGIDPSAISFTRSGEAVTLVIAETSSGAGNGGSITLVNGIETVNGRGIEQVVFDDGTVWSQADMRAKLQSGASNTRQDLINGTSN
ncbi:calcium-binding protein, partial [Aureimonas sp. D3]|uniref:calcium-binding protein n=1 Tax=Aureimonas sp. D3 TaxID=1638164 RepID=UPI000AD0B1E0